MQTPKRKPNPYSLIPPDYHFTKEAIQEFENEREKLLKKIRPKVIEEMQRAAEHGDFSENHAYQTAKWRLRGINGRIEELERKIGRAIVITPGSKNGKIAIGSTVTVAVNGKNKTFHILGAEEADPSKGIISHLSPLGAVLLGKKVGDNAELDNGEKKITYKILSIK